MMRALMKRFLFAVIFSAALLLCPAGILAQRQTVITGKLVGHDGRPMLKAHVHLTRLNQRQPAMSVQVSRDGLFRLATSETGLLFVQFTGVDHLQEEVPIYVDRPGRIKINARLSVNDYGQDFSGLKIIGDFNNFSSQSAQPMEKLPDGTYVAEFETQAKQFAYQLSGVRKSGGTINGTQSENYIYDGSGDYRSVVTPRNGRVRIVFDPNKLVRSTTNAQVRFVPAHSKAARFALIYDQMLKRRQPLSAALAAHKKGGKPAYEFSFDWSVYLSDLSQQIAKESDPLFRQLLLISYLDLGYGTYGARLEPALAQKALAEISPVSTLWAIEPDLIGIALKNSAAPDLYADYLQRIIDYHPDQKVRTLVRKEYAPNRSIMIGKAVPAFSLASLDNQTTYTNESLAGKVYLIDFWATWCVPCVEEMENLHAVYEKYNARGFEILSISLDEKPERVMEFRQGKWKMPWLNSFAVGGFQNETIKRFEISGLPKPILVDRLGRIIATGGDLRGAGLRKTLTLALGEDKKQ
jgi:thiol-disulfide isomerase/thioredoxin